jgi:hypothetical protein
VLVADINGNESRARFRLLVADPPEITRARIVVGEEGAYIEANLSDPDDAVVAVALASSADGETWREVDRRQSRLGGVKWQIHRSVPYWRIRAVDPIGAEAFALCRLPAEDAPAASYELERIPHRDFVDLVMRYDQVPSAAPLVRVGSTRFDPQQTDLREYRVAVPLKPGDTMQVSVAVYAQGADVQQIALDQQVVRPGTAQDLDYYAGSASLGFAAASAYAPFFPQVVAFAPHIPEHLVIAGPAYALGPEYSFDRKVELRLRYEGTDLPPEKLGIYQEVGEDKWVMVGNEWDAIERRVSAKLRRLGRYALLADLTAPEIEKLQPAAGAVVDGRPKIRAVLRDAGAGIGREEDIEFELDGRPLIAEYDPDADLVHGLLLADLAPGRHRLVLMVRDMSGNQAEARSEFEVR